MYLVFEKFVIPMDKTRVPHCFVKAIVTVMTRDPFNFNNTNEIKQWNLLVELKWTLLMLALLK